MILKRDANEAHPESGPVIFELRSALHLGQSHQSYTAESQHGEEDSDDDEGEEERGAIKK